MKNVVLIVASLLCGNLALAQKYSSKTGQVSFEASVLLFEDISAKDSNNLVILNADTGEIASVSMVKNYRFTVKLMEEHFNENYAESAKYPKATFTGKLANFDKAKLTASPQKYTLQGKLNFHGVDKAVTSSATIYAKDGKIYMQGGFVARPADYNVTIPKMVSKKVAENVNVKYDYILSK
ncbi:YceI family protein [Chryseobacterium polytrichastri]|uniref:YceI-like domain-containing protein n=1 Tax=Chryseobacterium polytrichastri TaxID=1302687 RepID=A0A1M6TNT1_9FLAO|nr:YceI family protein [Chryseobacterium polytrichastri]SHK58600.1 YceI-like domain-containing protein [Chryseobacterium polytrichastri]